MMKMSFTYKTFIGLTVVMLLSCCVKTEPVLMTESDNEICFSAPVMSHSTKAFTTGAIGDYPKEEHFTVSARYTPGDFMSWEASVPYFDDMDAGYDETKNGWTTAKGTGARTYYWPNSGKLTFAAYSPSSAPEDMTSLTYGKEGFTFTGFTVNPDPSQQYDLLYAPRAMNKTASSAGGSGIYDGVELNFRHALSCVEFKVRNGSNYAGSQIRINNIEVLNVYQRGSFTENIDVTDESVYEASPQWTDQGNELGTGYGVVPSRVEQIVEEEAKPLEGARSLLLIPQDFNHGSSHVTILITYETKTGANWIPQAPAVIDLVNGFDSDKDGFGDSYFNDGTNEIRGWEPGKRYTYMITFGRYKIFFTPSVSDWSDSNIPPVYI